MLRSDLEGILNEDSAASPLGGAHRLVLLIRRTVRPRGYASGAFVGCGLAWDKARLGALGLGG